MKYINNLEEAKEWFNRFPKIEVCCFFKNEEENSRMIACNYKQAEEFYKDFNLTN